MGRGMCKMGKEDNLSEGKINGRENPLSNPRLLQFFYYIFFYSILLIDLCTTDPHIPSLIP